MVFHCSKVVAYLSEARFNGIFLHFIRCYIVVLGVINILALGFVFTIMVLFVLLMIYENFAVDVIVFVR